MILKLFGIEETATNQLILLITGGATAYLFFSGLSYLVVFVLLRDRLVPSYRPDPAENRRAMFWGIVGNLGNALFTMPIHLAVAQGYSKVYWDVSEYGLAWLVLSVPIYLMFTETCIYWVHRWLHTVPFLWRRLHHIHHSWRSVTSWVSMAFHPLDSFAQALPHHLIGFFLPIHGLVYLAILQITLLWSVSIHDRVSLVRWKWLNYADHHTVHHWVGDFNYGQFFTVWDRWMGSYRDPDVLAAADPELAAEMGRGDGQPQVA